MLQGLKAPDLAARRVTQRNATSRSGHGPEGVRPVCHVEPPLLREGSPGSFTSLRTRGGVLT